MSSKVRLGVGCVLWLATSVMLSLIWTVLIGWRSGKVLFKDCHDGHCLQVLEGFTSHHFLDFEQHYEVWVTREGGSYGYELDHSFAYHEGLDDLATIRACRVAWADDGVSLIEPAGQRVFVPKHVYLGGR
jgi:hypothetical protein